MAVGVDGRQQATQWVVDLMCDTGSDASDSSQAILCHDLLFQGTLALEVIQQKLELLSQLADLIFAETQYRAFQI